jgi:hypothetical protein
MAERKLAVTGRMTLEDVGHDWTEECYVIYLSATIRERRQLQETDTASMTEDEATAQIQKFNRDHFVRGQVMVLDDNRQSVATAMQPEDLERLPLQHQYALFNSICGASTDPKGSQPAQQPAEPPPSAESTTATPSSEA